MKNAHEISKAAIDARDLVFEVDNLEDLRYISDAVRDQWDALERRMRNKFMPGDRVQWTGKRGFQEGVVQKRNPKNIKVLSDNGTMWTVSPSLLKKVNKEDANA